jgi:hypothetical protein
MATELYSISILLKSTNSSIFNGYFSIYKSDPDHTFGTITHFYETTNQTLDLLIPLTNPSIDGGANNICFNSNFTYQGTIINSVIPYFQNTKRLRLWFDLNGLFGQPNTYNISTSQTYDKADWVNITPYGTIFNMRIQRISSPPPVPKPFCIKFMNCLPKVEYSKVKTGNNNPQISTKMRYAQIVNSSTNEGRQTTISGAEAQQKYPNIFAPRTNIIIPLTNN